MTGDLWVGALTGRVVGGYRLDAFLGGGGFGVVFEGTNVSTQSRFAVKILLPSSNADSAVEFDHEGVLLQKLIKCSSVINWVDSGTDTIHVALNGATLPLPLKYHVLALASAVLEELISDPIRRAELPWRERLIHWRGAIKGVHQMHLNSVAHRDLKSSNCLLMLNGRNAEVRIADLGRSKDFSFAPTLPTMNYLMGRGDLRFAPPEHLWFQGGSSEQDFRAADLYGLGSLLVELATGHPMTALAIGSWQDARLQDARLQGHSDHLAGQRRDLGILRPQFKRAIEELSEEIPSVIRQDAAALIAQLCDPVPSQRQLRRRFGNRVVMANDLEWLLRRADILSRRVSIETRRRTCATMKTTQRSA